MDTMNYFAANIILSRVDSDSFLEMDPQVRLQDFGHLIGVKRMVSSSYASLNARTDIPSLSQAIINGIISRRLGEMIFSPSTAQNDGGAQEDPFMQKGDL